MLKKETFGTEEEFLKTRLKKKVINPVYAHYTFVKIKQEVISFINEGHNDASITIEDIHLSITPKHIDGDITLDIFHIGKKLSVNPIKMCMDLSEKINLEDSRYFVSVEIGRAHV